ncbi:hypothetical protein NEHOM01_1397 [Nematocida homosporus]|uniref:uncharacterized protein n=1 Tax=Nematocida homosporus TaxID=1912981 RepID=UPI00221EBA20|nr:uncharacterized protein NEHOM01_1397 [Nematocida homosporus]KAI5186333.1 hypothetical protein NEHOM01_1397 [Nematocida homosporus]
MATVSPNTSLAEIKCLLSTQPFAFYNHPDLLLAIRTFSWSSFYARLTRHNTAINAKYTTCRILYKMAPQKRKTPPCAPHQPSKVKFTDEVLIVPPLSTSSIPSPSNTSSTHPNTTPSHLNSTHPNSTHLTPSNTTPIGILKKHHPVPNQNQNQNPNLKTNSHSAQNANTNSNLNQNTKVKPKTTQTPINIYVTQLEENYEETPTFRYSTPDRSIPEELPHK